jgi:putative ABC transport system permease protein
MVPLGRTPGVMAAEPMQHRFAYVGNDLQDLYGIDPMRIGRATSMSNAYFASGNARATLAALAARPDGVLVSAETVTTYQLQRGDLLNLRLLNAADHQYHVVAFHFVDVVREFPTAPKDSFLIANARYLTQQTGSDAINVVLLRTSGRPARAAAQARALTGLVPGVSVTDIGSTQQTISSNLTAVNLHGLTQLELSFAVLLVAGATGLVIALGLAERRRTFAILAALGARRNQLASFLWSEALMILIGGGALGIGLGVAVAEMLVKLLTGVFDPPPEFLSVPWAYLAVLTVAALVSTGMAVFGAELASRRSIVEAVRSL